MNINISRVKKDTMILSSAIKLVLGISILAALSACSSIRYNGVTEANTIFDIFSFGEDAQAEADKKRLSEAAKPAEKTEEELKAVELALQQLRASEAGYSAQAAEDLPKVESTSTTKVVKTDKIKRGDSASKLTEIVVKQPEPSVSVERSVSASSEKLQSTPTVQARTTPETVVTSQPAEEALSGQPVVAPVAEKASPVSDDEQAIAAINQLTKDNPTAALAKDYKVLPEVSTKAELSVPNEILLLASPAEYRPEITEYGMWKIAKDEPSAYREHCTLASATMQVSFDNYSTQVWLKVVGDELLVNATTNIDINRPRVGVKLDNGPLQSFTKKHFQTSAVWSGDLESALNTKKRLSVIIGGNELGARTQEVSVELKDLKRAYAEYRKCNATTQIGSL